QSRVGTGTPAGTGRARLVSTNLPNVCASLTRGAPSGMGKDARSRQPHTIPEKEVMMETHTLRLVEGTAALSPPSPLEMEFAKDRWDAHNIPGLRYAAHSSHYHIHFA